MKLFDDVKKKLKTFFRPTAKKQTSNRNPPLFKREHYPTYISQATKWRVNIARRSSFIDQDTKNQVLPKIKKLSLKLAHLNLQEERILFLRGWAYRLSLLLFMLLVVPVAVEVLRLSTWRHINIYQHLFVSILSFVFLIFLDNRWHMIEIKFSFRNRLTLLMLILLVFLGGVSFLERQFNGYSVVFSEYLLVVIYFGVAGYFSINFISVIVDTLIRMFFDFFGYRNLPENIVVHNILMVLDHFGKTTSNMTTDISIKVRVLDRLEYVAEAIERDLPSKMQTRNNNFNRWTKKTSQKIAASFREREKWVVTPKEDTLKYLTEFLVNFLLHFVRGDWDRLEQMEIPEFTAGDWWAKRILPVLRPVLLLGLPMIAYLWLQNSRFAGESWMGTVTGYLIMWLVINFVSLLDPSAKEKIGALADTAGMF